MRLAIVLFAALGCHSSSAPKSAAPALAIVGYGVQIVPAPSTSAAILDNGVLIFGPRGDRPPPAEVRNVLVKPGKSPAGSLTPRATGPGTTYSDGASDTTSIMTGVGMTTFDGVLEDVSLSKRTGSWTIVSDGKDQAWAPGLRLDVADDGHSFKLVAR